jgi:hypothetical protein
VNREVKQALEIAANALDIVADWNIDNVQVNPPVEWKLDAWGEDTADGWCSTRELAQKLRELAKE